MRVTEAGGSFEGIAETVDEEGRLIVRLPSGIRKVLSAGDVTMLR